MDIAETESGLMAAQNRLLDGYNIFIPCFELEVPGCSLCVDVLKPIP